VCVIRRAEAARGYEHGNDDFFTEPFVPDFLMAALALFTLRQLNLLA